MCELGGPMSVALYTSIVQDDPRGQISNKNRHALRAAVKATMELFQLTEGEEGVQIAPASKLFPSVLLCSACTCMHSLQSLTTYCDAGKAARHRRAIGICHHD